MEEDKAEEEELEPVDDILKAITDYQTSKEKGVIPQRNQNRRTIF